MSFSPPTATPTPPRTSSPRHGPATPGGLDPRSSDFGSERLRARLRRLRLALLDLFYPPACVAHDCGRPGAWLCAACEALIVPASAGRLADLADHAAFDLRALGRIDAGGYYATPLSDAVRALKYRRRAALAPLLADRMLSAGPPGPCGTLVVAVPAHPARVRARGIDHAGLLAAELARLQGLELCAGLSRIRDTASQTGLSRLERRRNLEGAFVAKAALEGRRVILVDDVLTTGATAMACAEALLRAGVNRVDLRVAALADRWAV